MKSPAPHPRHVPLRAAGGGRLLSELRRSHAAGKHGKYRKDRSNTRRAAIQRDRDA